MTEDRASRIALRFHEDRDRLLAEAHARPSTPLPSPTLATRIAALSGDDGPQIDWAHMVSLCRRLGAPEPSPGARWCVLDAGSWRLRWERHTEVSTWTFYRPIAEDVVPPLNETALDLAPRDWLAKLPGDVLVAAHIVLLRKNPPGMPVTSEEEIASEVADGAAQIYTDFRPGPDAFTRIRIVQPHADAALAGRIVQQMFEIETYRLMALLAFPLAGRVGAQLSRLESQAARAALQVSEDGGIEADRALLNRLANLAGEAQALSGQTSFRFSAARAYYGLVQERIQQLRERRLEGRPTIGEFMERRLAPAMRTCAAVAERLQDAIEHISTTSQLLNTRVDVAAEVTNANLLASMERRARLQLRLQQTVEGLSVAAISYYALGLLGYVFKAASDVFPKFDTGLATGIAAPFVVLFVWWALEQMRARIVAEENQPPR
ncbi:MAG: DUF3422 domain-containing protein [Proteobacteria bacterium]|nr:DUF3422 domain-containing protein [Pseudomonadota bacterium]